VSTIAYGPEPCPATGSEARPNPSRLSPRWLAAIDGLLIAGIKLGPAKKHEAIDKILELAPRWTRGDCWCRIRHLRKTGVVGDSAASDGSSEKPARRAEAGRLASRPWTPADDDKLLNWAGYEPVDKIAQRLGRSVRAVRFRLCALGMSAKVTDGHSQRELRKLLHVSTVKLRQFIGRGMLRVRDARITAASLAAFCRKSPGPHGPALAERLTSAAAKDAAYSSERTADLLRISVDEVQALIGRGQLKLVDTFVTDRSFEDFCRKHGDEINPRLMDAADANWLINEYGVVNPEDGQPVPRAQKHALIVRTCGCGRKIAGNVFFRHVRHCPAAMASGPIIKANEPTRAPTAHDSSTQKKCRHLAAAA